MQSVADRNHCVGTEHSANTVNLTMKVVSPYVVGHMALAAKRSANRDAMAGAPYRSLPRSETAAVALGVVSRMSRPQLSRLASRSPELMMSRR
jgi:hypothetical protein